MNDDVKKELHFHVLNNDYFGTLATVIDLGIQDIVNNGFKPEHEKVFKKKIEELLFLQKNFYILKK